MNSVLAAKQILENYDARVPKDNDRVYKDECLYSFDSPVSITNRNSGGAKDGLGRVVPYLEMTGPTLNLIIRSCFIS